MTLTRYREVPESLCQPSRLLEDRECITEWGNPWGHSSGSFQVENYKLLRLGLRSGIHEWPQAVGRPLESRLGPAGDDFGLLWLVGLGKGIGRWYLAHHVDARKGTAAWHDDCSILSNQKKTAMAMGAPFDVIRISQLEQLRSRPT